MDMPFMKASRSKLIRVLPELQGLLFDIDGTLYRQTALRLKMGGALLQYSLLHPVQAMRIVAILQGYQKAQERMRFISNYDCNIAEYQLRVAAQVAKAPYRQVVDTVRLWFQTIPLRYLRSVVRPGLTELLEKAKARRLKIAAVSDYPCRDKLEILGISEYFDAVVCAQDPQVQRLKPHPRGIFQALTEIGVPADSAVYVGDRPEVDAVAARAAGVRAVILSPRRSTGEWVTIHGFDELLTMIEGVPIPEGQSI
jgi:HAD superfamily hydrolase (TIGR01549 family)